MMTMAEQPASDFATGAILVVAHPDDEILWFSGVLRDVKRIVVCFTDDPRARAIGDGRRRVQKRYPLPNVTWLDIEEPMSFLSADWRAPRPGPHGLVVSRWDGARARYARAYDQVTERLADELVDCTAVITHNPWGEYGHEDHVLVHRAVSAIASSRGLRVWHSNYCSSRSVEFATSFMPSDAPPYVVRKTDPALTVPIKKMYVEESCWTWWPDHAWFADECYMPALSASASSPADGHGFPINFLRYQSIPQAIRPHQRIFRLLSFVVRNPAACARYVRGRLGFKH